HLCATATHGLGAVALIGIMIWDLVRTESPLVRRRIAVVALGTLVAFLVPAVFWAWSVAVRGSVPLNAAAFTAFLFPVSLAYAVAKADLFEIDVLLRRATGYVVTVLALATVYLGALSLVGMVLPKGFVADSPLALATLNLAVLFLIAPMKARMQA